MRPALTLALALVLAPLGARAQRRTPPTEAPRAEHTEWVDASETARENQRLEAGTAAEKLRVLQRAAASDDPASIARLAFAATQAARLALDDHALLTVARGLAPHAHRSTVRSALWALLDGARYDDLVRATAAFALAAHADADTTRGLIEHAGNPATARFAGPALQRHPPRALALPSLPSTHWLRGALLLDDPRMAPAVERTLQQSRDEGSVLAALEAARQLGDARTLAAVRRWCDDPRPALADAALLTLATLAPEQAARKLGVLLAQRSSPMLLRAVGALPEALGAPLERVAIPRLLQRLTARRDDEALAELSLLRGVDGARALGRLLEADSPYLHPAAFSLARHRHGLPVLRGKLAAPAPAVQREAAVALFELGQSASADAVAARQVLASQRLPDPLTAVLRPAPEDPLRGLAELPEGDAPTSNPALQRARALLRGRHGYDRRRLHACASALRLEAPFCAYAFAARLPIHPDAALREQLEELADSPDPAIVSMTFAGLEHSDWPGYAGRLAAQLESALQPSVRRGLAALASRALTQRAPSGALERTIARLLQAEPDAAVETFLRQRPSERTARSVVLRRAPGEAGLRCGYVHDELGHVAPLLFDVQGVSVVRGLRGAQVDVTLAPRCDAPMP